MIPGIEGGVERIGGIVADLGAPATNPAARARVDFTNMLSNAVTSLDDAQRQADVVVGQIATGDSVDIHSAVVATETTAIGFQLAMQIRNRLVEAYQDVMRTQI